MLLLDSNEMKQKTKNTPATRGKKNRRRRRRRTHIGQILECVYSRDVDLFCLQSLVRVFSLTLQRQRFCARLVRFFLYVVLLFGFVGLVLASERTVARKLHGIVSAFKR